MRTTIEITDEQRAKLLSIAATKGMKGFSSLVREALEEYLSKSEMKEKHIKAALAVMGTLDDDEAQSLKESCAAVRESWR